MSKDRFCGDADCEGVSVCKCRNRDSATQTLDDVLDAIRAINNNCKDFPDTFSIIPPPEHESEMIHIKKISAQVLKFAKLKGFEQR